jgi:RNA polymerase sigma factor (sigma-70 family)
MVDHPRKGVLEYIRGMAAAQQAMESSDAELLTAFVAKRDQAAFAEMVRRYTPLVLRVCRCVLRGHLQDAEDALQATFLLFARKAGSIRKKDSLAEWLHGVAYRVAQNARRGSQRRRLHEEKVDTGQQRAPDWEAGWREVQGLLHEEIARLPKAFREVFVLCCLEEKSGGQVARQLGVKGSTVSRRLAKARQLLRQRLARRGVDLSAVLAGLAIWQSEVASASISLASRTARAVISAVTNNPAASGAISAGVAALAEGVNRAMFRMQCKVFTILLLAASLTAGIVGLGMIPRPPVAREALPLAAPPAAAASHPKANEDNSAALVLSGRVLDPAEKPVAGAKLYLLDFADAKAPPKVRATSDADGRFRFTIARKDVQLPPYRGNRWDSIFLCAMAEGHGPALARVSKPEATDERTLHLVKDDVLIRGRVLDLQGKPVSGSTVRVIGLLLPNKGDLASFVEALKASKDGYPVENAFLVRLDNPAIAQLFVSASTKADGRFQLKGIGRERIAIVEISGPTIETWRVRVMTRPGERMDRLAWKEDVSKRTLAYYGASFDHVAGPTTPIIGVVRDKDTKKPLAGAIVTSPIHRNGGNTFIHTTADNDGRYRLVGMPRGEGGMINVMGPEGQPYLEVKLGVPAAQGLESVTVDAELKRGVWIRGHVTDKATGKPVPAEIAYYPFKDNPHRKDAPGFQPWNNTKDDGTFQFVGLPGRGVIGARGLPVRYLVGVGSEKFNFTEQIRGSRIIEDTSPPIIVNNYHTLIEVAPAKDAASLTCDITLDPGRTLTGTVVGPDGKPLSGVRMGGVTPGWGFPLWEGNTQPTAEFTVFAVKAGQKRYVLALHEEKQLAGSLMIQGDEKGPLTIQLKPWAVVSGRLVHSDGQPRPNAELNLERSGQRLFDPDSGYHRVRSFRTDKDGKFRIDALVPGLKYTMTHTGTIFEDLKLKSGETKDLGDVQVKE